MSSIGLLTLALCAFLQAISLPLFQGDALNAEEKATLGTAEKIDDRIKVYHSASKRIQQSVHAAVHNQDFSSVQDSLKRWGSILSGSLEDIEANLKTTKKPKALIRYEIQVRKAITEFRGYKTKVPLEQQDEFDAQLAGAEKIRKRFVELIFQ
jgi:hypothetical protein